MTWGPFLEAPVPNTTHLSRHLPHEMVAIIFYYQFGNDSKNKVLSQMRKCFRLLCFIGNSNELK